MAHLQRGGAVRSGMELETDFNKAVLGTYETRCPAKIVKLSIDVPWWNRNVARMKLFNRAKKTAYGLNQELAGKLLDSLQQRKLT